MCAFCVKMRRRRLALCDSAADNTTSLSTQIPCGSRHLKNVSLVSIPVNFDVLVKSFFFLQCEDLSNGLVTSFRLIRLTGNVKTDSPSPSQHHGFVSRFATWLKTAPSDLLLSLIWKTYRATPVSTPVARMYETQLVPSLRILRQPSNR